MELTGFDRFELGMTHRLMGDGLFAASRLLETDLCPPAVLKCREEPDGSLFIVVLADEKLSADATIPQGQWEKI